MLVLLALSLLTGTLAWGQPVHKEGGVAMAMMDGVEGGVAVAMMDGMQQLLTGGGEFDREFLALLANCMDELDPNMRMAGKSG